MHVSMTVFTEGAISSTVAARARDGGADARPLAGGSHGGLEGQGQEEGHESEEAAVADVVSAEPLGRWRVRCRIRRECTWRPEFFTLHVLVCRWAGYGAVNELELDPLKLKLIEKIVQPPDGDGSVSHERKIKSYDVEADFYRHVAPRARTKGIKIPELAHGKKRHSNRALALLAVQGQAIFISCKQPMRGPMLSEAAAAAAEEAAAVAAAAGKPSAPSPPPGDSPYPPPWYNLSLLPTIARTDFASWSSPCTTPVFLHHPRGSRTSRPITHGIPITFDSSSCTR
eukprot:4632016-Pleurochrysis_carterae.AAC.2